MLCFLWQSVTQSPTYGGEFGLSGLQLDHLLPPGRLSPSELVSGLPWSSPAHGISKQKTHECIPTRCETSSSGSPAPVPAIACVMLVFWEMMQALAEGADGSSPPRVSGCVPFSSAQTTEQQINQFILEINPHRNCQGRKNLYCSNYIL